MTSECAVKPCLYNSVSQVDLPVFLMFYPELLQLHLNVAWLCKMKSHCPGNVFITQFYLCCRYLKKWEPASSFLYVGTITCATLLVLLTLCGVMRTLWMWPSVAKESESEHTKCCFLLAAHISEIFSRWVGNAKQASWKWSAYLHVILYTVAFDFLCSVGFHFLLPEVPFD